MTVVHAHKLHVLSKLSLRNLKVSNRVLKCDVIKNYICEIYGIYRDILKEQNLKGLFAKNSFSGQIVPRILYHLCSDDFIQIFLNLTRFIML